MAISTSIDFNQTVNQIITRALKLIQVLGAGQVPTTDDYTDCKDALNAMLKAWQTQGLHLFGKTEGVLVPAVNTTKYSFSSDSSSANIARADDFFINTLSANEATGQTILSVTSTSTISVNDKIGITLEDGSIQWTTVASKTSNTVTVNNALTDDAVSGAYLYSYTTRIDRPVKILSARSYNVSSEVDLNMTDLSHDDYYSIPNKTSTSATPLSFYYDPQISTGYMYVWPMPTTITHLIKFTYQRQITDVDALTDNVDFPQEWLDPITYSLAVRIGPLYGRIQEANALLPLASLMTENALLFDNEPQSIVIRPSRR
jgi:hypothetical protein